MIKRFKGPREFLSNFFPSSVYVPMHNMTAPTAEHAFQSMKTYDREEAKRILTAENPSKAKKIGKIVKLRVDWEDVKINIMYEIIRNKFKKNRNLGDLLVATHRHTLIEGNIWHDNYWGDCQCERCVDIVGKNILGKILMDIRFEIILEHKLNFDPECFIVGSNHTCSLCRNCNRRCIICNSRGADESVCICFMCMNKINDSFIELAKQDICRIDEE